MSEPQSTDAKRPVRRLRMSFSAVPAEMVVKTVDGDSKGCGASVHACPRVRYPTHVVEKSSRRRRISGSVRVSFALTEPRHAFMNAM